MRGFDCKAKKKLPRQLWGVGIADKRYTLFEKIFDQNDKLIDIKVVNPQGARHRFPLPAKKTIQETGRAPRHCGFTRCRTTSCADSSD